MTNLKLITIITTIIIMVVAVVSTLQYIFPHRFTAETIVNIQDAKEVELLEFNLTNPKYAFYVEDDFGTNIYVQELERENLFWWRIKGNSFDDITGYKVPFSAKDSLERYGGKSFEDTKQTIVTDIQENDPLLQLKEKRLPFRNSDVKNRNIFDYVNLKAGMTNSEVNSIIGNFADQAQINQELNKDEVLYIIDNNEKVNYISLVWSNGDPLDKPEGETLLETIYVFKTGAQKTFLNINDDGTFDFSEFE